MYHFFRTKLEEEDRRGQEKQRRKSRGWVLPSVLPRAARVLDQSGQALAAGQRRRHGAPFLGPHGVVEESSREMSNGCPGLATLPGRRRAAPCPPWAVLAGGRGRRRRLRLRCPARRGADRSSIELCGELHARSPSLRRHGLPLRRAPAAAGFIAWGWEVETIAARCMQC